MGLGRDEMFIETRQGGKHRCRCTLGVTLINDTFTSTGTNYKVTELVN